MMEQLKHVPDDSYNGPSLGYPKGLEDFRERSSEWFQRVDDNLNETLNLEEIINLFGKQAGLKWHRLDLKKPPTGTEIENEALALALSEKISFTQEELDNFNVSDLSYDSYIKAGDYYFTPTEKGINESKDHATLFFNNFCTQKWSFKGLEMSLNESEFEVTITPIQCQRMVWHRAYLCTHARTHTHTNAHTHTHTHTHTHKQTCTHAHTHTYTLTHV